MLLILEFCTYGFWGSTSPFVLMRLNLFFVKFCLKNLEDIQTARSWHIRKWNIYNLVFITSDADDMSQIFIYYN